MAKRQRRTKAEMEAAKKHKAALEYDPQKHDAEIILQAEIEKTEGKVSLGLGDTVEKITEATGIKKVVKTLFGDDCGCDDRKQKLNKWFRYVECLTEEEYNTLGKYQKTNTLSIKDQDILLKIYNRVFNKKETMSSCTQCWKERMSDLRKVYNEYEKENK